MLMQQLEYEMQVKWKRDMDPERKKGARSYAVLQSLNFFLKIKGIQIFWIIYFP